MTTTTNTMTERNAYNALMSLISGGEMSYTDKAGEVVSVTESAMLDFLNHRIEVLDKKASYRSNTTTPKQAENIEFEPVVLAILQENGAQTAKEIIDNGGDELFSKIENKVISVNRLTPILKKLVNAGQVTVTYDKRKTYYSIAE
jgi:hypothetical protein